VDPNGLAAVGGLSMVAPGVLTSNTRNTWSLTEINSRPLNMFFKDNEVCKTDFSFSNFTPWKSIQALLLASFSLLIYCTGLSGREIQSLSILASYYFPCVLCILVICVGRKKNTAPKKMLTQVFIMTGHNHIFLFQSLLLSYALLRSAVQSELNTFVSMEHNHTP
jgi:hypothetical protein